MKKGTPENIGWPKATSEASRFSGGGEILETSADGKGVISMKTTPRIGKVFAINLVDDTTETVLTSQFGKIIRIDTKTIRSAGRSTSDVKLINLETDDKEAATVAIPPKTPKSNPKAAHCCNN